MSERESARCSKIHELSDRVRLSGVCSVKLALAHRIASMGTTSAAIPPDEGFDRSYVQIVFPVSPRHGNKSSFLFYFFFFFSFFFLFSSRRLLFSFGDRCLHDFVSNLQPISFPSFFDLSICNFAINLFENNVVILFFYYIYGLSLQFAKLLEFKDSHKLFSTFRKYNLNSYFLLLESLCPSIERKQQNDTTCYAKP